MIQIKNEDKKLEVAKKIQELVVEINKEIELSNNENLFIDISFTQNSGIKPKNSYLNVFITETVSY